MKKLTFYLLGMFIWVVLFLWVGNIANATEWGGFMIQNDAAKMGVIWWEQWGSGSRSFIDVVQNIIRWLLSILAIITVIVLLYGWFNMITAAWDDEKYKKWFIIAKQATIWLIFIWLAWLFVMIVFYVINWAAWWWGAWGWT